MVLIAILFWIACLLFSPITPIGGISISAFVYLFLCLLFFWIGTIRIKKKKKVNTNIVINAALLERIYKYTFILGGIGSAFKYYDMVFLRDATFLLSDDASLEIGEGGSVFSVISGMLIFFTYIPITIDAICPRLHKFPIKFLSYFIFFATGLSAATSGSRFAIILPIVYFLLLMMYTRKFSLKFSKRNISIVVAIILIIGYIIGGLYLARIELMGADSSDYIFNAGGYTRKVPISRSFSQFVVSQKETLGGLPFVYLFAYSNIVQYETHGVFEFPGVMENIDRKGDFFYGQATFWVYAKLIYKVVGSNYNLAEDVAAHDSAPGLWSTFFFQWYLDFGWIGVILMFFVGYIAKQIWSLVYDKGNILALPLLFFMSMVWLMILNLNQISSQGAYAIFSFVLLIILFKKRIICNVQKA